MEAAAVVVAAVVEAAAAMEAVAVVASTTWRTEVDQIEQHDLKNRIHITMHRNLSKNAINFFTRY